MIKDFDQVVAALPRIGVVRKGAPKPDGRPGKDLDYFRFITPHASVMAAWNAVMGQQPKQISGILPYSDPYECLSQWDELWVGPRMLWRGDGEQLHIELKGNSYVSYPAGSGPQQPARAGAMVGKNKVSRVSRLRLLMPQLRVAGIVEVLSSSPIDADELWSNLSWIRTVVATLQGAPVTVFRSPRTFQVPNKEGDGTIKSIKHMLGMMLDQTFMDDLLPKPMLPDRTTLALPISVSAAVDVEPVSPDDEDGGVETGDWEDELPSSLDEFLEQSQSRPGVDAILFAPVRLRSWVNYVTDGGYQSQHSDLLFEVLDAYCSMVEEGGRHTAALVKRAKDSYREKVRARLIEQGRIVIDERVEDGVIDPSLPPVGAEDGSAVDDGAETGRVQEAGWLGGDDPDGQEGLMIMNSMGHPNG